MNGKLRNTFSLQLKKKPEPWKSNRSFNLNEVLLNKSKSTFIFSQNFIIYARLFYFQIITRVDSQKNFVYIIDRCICFLSHSSLFEHHRFSSINIPKREYHHDFWYLIVYKEFVNMSVWIGEKKHFFRSNGKLIANLWTGTRRKDPMNRWTCNNAHCFYWTSDWQFDEGKD